ncbi:ABC transporter ATP-binding protein [Andreprevotia chitinilytica]|uniref:ABC transporter ATP-binding protein n=1 Tax=Andreprevotia chitinilytica TaxID=396808 RepID=UPI000554BE17|nr:sn-glycerol-3-phosphate ABC transporter ATP-binding protein UgpC [Andreprevotia chitinilytica]
MAGVTLKNVCKSYDSVQVINDVSLEIADGEFCVFVGPSGCGKSTLLRMIAGLEDITTGDMKIGGRRVNELAPSERNVSMVFQSYALYPHMDVAQNMAFGLKLAGVSKEDIQSRVAGIASMLQIDRFLKRKPRALSGGQRQRVAIGRALVRDPEVFLFDEPLSNLDAALRTQTRVEIARLHKEYAKASTIYVTHDQVEAMTLADKIVLLNTGADVAKYGSVAQIGSPLELYERPGSVFVAGFLGSPKMNFLDGTVDAVTAAGVQIKTRDGFLLRANVQAKDVAIGDKVQLGVRPEHVEHATTATGNNVMQRTIQWVEHLGDCTYAYLEGDRSVPMIVRLHASSRVAAGEVMSIHVPMGNAHVFREDGRALPRLWG